MMCFVVCERLEVGVSVAVRHLSRCLKTTSIPAIATVAERTSTDSQAFHAWCRLGVGMATAAVLGW